MMLVNNVGLKAYTYVVLVQAKHGESMHACIEDLHTLFSSQKQERRLPRLPRSKPRHHRNTENEGRKKTA